MGYIVYNHISNTTLLFRKMEIIVVLSKIKLLFDMNRAPCFVVKSVKKCAVLES
jgi:hypothetical protein